jgi:hypothetical protein
MPDELISLRKETSKTYDLGGRKRRCVIGGVQHYKDNYADKSEQWKEIDLAFINGRIDKAPYILEVDGLTVKLTSKRTGTVQTISLDEIGGIKASKIDKWEVIGNTLTWKNAAQQTDVVIEATRKGFKYKRVLKGKNAPLEAKYKHSKTVGLYDDIYLPTSAVDADGEPLELAVTNLNGELSEALNIDKGKVKYPLEVDPSPLIVQPSTKDTYLYLYYDDNNYNGYDFLRVLERDSYTQRTITEFDISGLPVVDSLDSATLEFYYYGYTATDPVGKTVWAYKQTRTDWVEAEATWNSYKTGSSWTAPGGDYVTSSPTGGSTTFPAGYGWMEWDVLAIVQDAYDGSIAAEFLLKYETEGLSSGYSTCSFYSNDYTGDTSKCPKLTIEYTEGSTAYESVLTTAMGMVASLSREAAYNRSQTTEMGMSASISRNCTYNRLQTTAMGMATSISRTATYNRILTTAMGMVSTLSSVHGFVRSLTTSIGMVASLTRNATYNRTLSTTVGMSSTISRTVTYGRSLATSMVMSVSLSRTANYIRSLTTSTGMSTTLGRTASYGRILTTSMAMSASLSRIQNFVRTLSTAMGMAARISWGGKFKRILSRIGTNRTVGHVGTNRNVERTGTNRDVEPW